MKKFTHFLALIQGLFLLLFAGLQTLNAQILNDASHVSKQKYFNQETNGELSLPLSNDADFDLNFQNPSAECERVFWTVDNSNQIKEWFIDDHEISGGEVINTSIGFGLAFCGVGEKASFYSDNFPNHGVAYFDKEEGWTIIPNDKPLLNNGGNGDDQYFQGLYDGSGTALYHFDGENFTLIYYLEDSIFSVADVAVDSAGHAWVFTGVLLENMDTLMVINPEGEILREYAMDQDPNTCYGSFFLEDQLYVGKEDSIFQVITEGDTAYFANPISFPYEAYTDLASCHSNTTIVATKETAINSDINIYPNPTTSWLSIESIHDIISVQCYDMYGKKIQLPKTGEYYITKHLAPACYTLLIYTDQGWSNHTFIKQL